MNIMKEFMCVAVIVAGYFLSGCAGQVQGNEPAGTQIECNTFTVNADKSASRFAVYKNVDRLSSDELQSIHVYGVGDTYLPTPVADKLVDVSISSDGITGYCGKSKDGEYVGFSYLMFTK